MTRITVMVAWMVVAGAALSGCRGASSSGDDSVAALAAAVESCPYQQGYDLDCAAYKVFLDGLNGGSDDLGLVSLVEDAEPKRRWLGATGLVRRGRHFHEDPTLRARLFEAARGEVDPAVAKALGAALCRTENRSKDPDEKTGAAPDDADTAALRRLAEEHPLPAMRAALLGELLGYGGDRWFDFTEVRLGNDEDVEVRRAGLAALMSADPARAAEVCAIWQRHADADPDAGTAAAAAKLRASWGRCR
jgi:hypothetical protein